MGTTLDNAVCADGRGKKVAARRDAAPAPTRPSEPPALMVFKPCLRCVGAFGTIIAAYGTVSLFGWKTNPSGEGTPWIAK